MAPDAQQVRFANQKNPHHVQYWSLKGFSEKDAKACASAGHDVCAKAGGHSPAQVKGHAGAIVPAKKPLQNNSMTVLDKKAKALVGLQVGSSTVDAVVTVQEKQVTCPLYTSLQIDTSRSMAGEPIRNVIEQCADVLKTVQHLKKMSLMSIATFDTRCTQILVDTRVKDVNFDAVATIAAKSAASGGATALYDAIVDGIANLGQHSSNSTVGGCHYILATFTDGDDNNSSNTVETVRKALKHPGFANFQFLVISAGLSSESRATLDNMVAGMKHCTHLPAQSTSRKDLSKVFQQFTTMIKEMLKVEILRKPGDPAVMPKLVNSFAQNCSVNVIAAGGKHKAKKALAA